MKLQGIEVYLKPVGEGFDTRKFREVPCNISTHNSHYAESHIQKFSGSIAFALRFPEDFESPARSAMIVEISMQGLSKTGTFGTYRFVISNASIDSRSFCLSDPQRLYGKKPLKFSTDGFKNATSTMDVPLHGVEVEAGTINVTITHVHMRWIGDLMGRYGPLGPHHIRTMANPLDLQTFKPLEGDSGRTRTFVFRPLAKAAYKEAADRCSQSLPVALSLDLVGFTADNSYVADRLLRETRLEEMVAYWKREHAEIENKSNGAPLVRSSPHRNTSPTRATTSKPLVIEDSLNDPSTCPPKAILESARPVDNSIIPASAKSNAKKTPRSPPTTCNCPLKHRKAPRRVPSSKDGENGGVDGTHLKLKRLPRAKRAQDDDEPPDPEPSEKSQETLAVECSQCTQLKAPPRGKKIAFRKSRGRFMYVPQSAPGDDDAEDTARNDRSQQMDEVDEEIVPQSVKMADPAPSKHAIRRATETPAPEDRPVFRLATKEPEKRPEDVQIERSFAPADVPIPGATATNASVTNQVSGQEPQTVEEAPFTEQPIIPHDGAAPSEMVVDNAPVIEAVREDSRAAAEVIATNHSTASSEQPVPSEEASRDTSASDAIVPNSSAASQVATGTESKKRSSPAPVEERPAKQQRIDVDLTGDDDLVHVKSEVFEDREQSAAKGMSKVEEEAELEADLEDIRLQRIDIRLAREAAEKSRNLRRLRESRSGAAA